MIASAWPAVAASVVSMAAVYAAGPWLRRWAGPHVVYACWVLPWLGVIALALPARLDTAIIGLHATWIATGSANSRFAAELAGTAWAVVAGLFVAFQLAAYWLYIRHASRDAVEIGRAGAVRVMRGPNVRVPVAAGLLRRRIFVPDDFETAFSPDERRMIVRHEQAHHHRHDIAANLFAVLMVSLHWWNPLAYRAHRRFRADQELSCDASAITGLGRRERHAYGTAILKCAGQARSLAAAMGGRGEAVTRLSLIAADVPADQRLTLPAVLLVTFLSSLTLVEGAATRLASGVAVLPAARQAQMARELPLAPPDEPGAGFCDGGSGGVGTPARYQPLEARTRLIVAGLDSRRTRDGPTRAA